MALSLLMVTLWASTLAANIEENYALINVYELHGKIFIDESNRSQSCFKDINVSFKLLKSHTDEINISTVASYSRQFKPLAKTETFHDPNTTYWLQVDLGEHFPSGRYIYLYGDTDFTDHSIAPSQTLDKFRLEGTNHAIFTYTQGVDARVYYFKLAPKHFKIPLKYIIVSTQEAFYSYKSKKQIFVLIMGSILGLIAMAAIYNGAMYCYNKDIAFLYYTLMQFFMVLTLLDVSGVMITDDTSFFTRNLHYEHVINLAVAFFATLFSIHFLHTRRYLPRLHDILRICAGLIGLDIIVSTIYQSLLLEYYVLPFVMIPMVLAGYARMRQGHKPARYYVAGWAVFLATVFVVMFEWDLEAYFLVDPLFFGAATEAILFSFALSYKMHMLAQEKEEQKRLLMHQSKLASMGEMLGNIAHQWRQPLTHLGYTFMNIQDAQQCGELDKTYLGKKIAEAHEQLAFMSQTINDFKDFFLPDKTKEHFTPTEATQEILEIMRNTLKYSNIDITLQIHNNTPVYNYKNEYKHVLVNLLSNAKEALTQKAVQDPQIRISIDGNTITIEDNAGGIPEAVLPRIFEPYFSTKEDGTGIGLYMSKIIVEKNMGGTLTISNTHRGALCQLIFPDNGSVSHAHT